MTSSAGGGPRREQATGQFVPPQTPAGEPERLATLRATHLLNTPAEERFDRITRIARHTFGVPIALVSLVDESRQWFKSCQGLPVRQTSREISFCGHAVAADDTLIVHDATRDDRFRGNPLVVSDPRIRFYAGEPIRVDGHALGTLCVIDRVPRSFGAQDRATLQALGRLVEEQFRVASLEESRNSLLVEVDEMRRLALLDDLTLVWNRRGVDEVLQRELERNARQNSSLAVALVDVDHFKQVNDRYGHPTGDAVLREVSQRLRGGIRPYDAVGRYGGEEFLVVLPGASAEEAAVVGNRIREGVQGRPVQVERETVSVTVSVGVAAASDGDEEAGSLVARADSALYRSKDEGRNRVSIAPENDVQPATTPGSGGARGRPAGSWSAIAAPLTTEVARPRRVPHRSRVPRA